MNLECTEMTVSDTHPEPLRMSRQELLEKARQLNHLGKRFERYMSLQLQQLELTIDDFEREKEAWQRQKERELYQINSARPHLISSAIGSQQVQRETNRPDSVKTEAPDPPPGHSTAPLLMLVDPGEASEMQLGLLLFEISKLSREFGGGGVRFEVNTVRLRKRKNKSGQERPIIGIEAFSYVPLLAHDGAPTRQLRLWEQFKSKILVSSVIDRGLLKEFKKSVKAPRDHDLVNLAVESTRRAENANTKCDAMDQSHFPDFYSNSRDQRPKQQQQQQQRIEDVFGYLQKEYGVRVHLSLIW